MDQNQESGRNDMTSKRNLLIGATFVGAVGRARRRPEPADQGGGAGRKRRDGAAVRSRSDLAEAAAERLSARSDDRRRGRRARSRLDRAPRQPGRRRGGGGQQDRPVLHGRAIRSWSSIRPATCCGTGAARTVPGYQWPASNHGIWVDHKGNVWIGGNGKAATAWS